MASGRFFTPERIATLKLLYYPRVFPEPAHLTIKETGIHDRESAYAFAIMVMQEADRLWPER